MHAAELVLVPSDSVDSSLQQWGVVRVNVDGEGGVVQRVLRGENEVRSNKFCMVMSTEVLFREGGKKSIAMSSNVYTLLSACWNLLYVHMFTCTLLYYTWNAERCSRLKVTGMHPWRMAREVRTVHCEWPGGETQKRD